MRERTRPVAVRFLPREIKEIRKEAKERGGTLSDFIRFCVNTQLAQGGDKVREKLLVDMIFEGMKKMVARMVEHEKKKISG